MPETSFGDESSSSLSRISMTPSFSFVLIACVGCGGSPSESSQRSITSGSAIVRLTGAVAAVDVDLRRGGGSGLSSELSKTVPPRLGAVPGEIESIM